MIEFEITHDFIRSGSNAFGVDVAVHHSTAAAQAAGLADIVMSTPQLGALVERFVLENWGARISDLRLAMKRPVFAGTTVVLTGEASYNGWTVTISHNGVMLVSAACS